MLHLDKHVNYQHGFHKNRSCETKLINPVEHLACLIDHRCQIDLLILDFSKALDKVAHNRLLQKVNHYHGVRGTTLSWMHSWLTNRTQVVLVGSCSEKSIVKSGVPQGTEPFVLNTDYKLMIWVM